MKPRRAVTLPEDDRTIFVHMTSGAVIRLRPSELVGWIVSDLKPEGPKLIEPPGRKQDRAFQIGGAQKRKAQKPN